MEEHPNAKISAYMITRNEEKNIARCLESVKWMDEVIVVDSESSDRTVEIAEKYNAKVFQMEFSGFVDQKNAALELCSNEWVFNIDADEEVGEELKQSILDTIVSNPDHAEVYNVNRKTFYMGKWMNFSGWYPEYRARLSKKGKARWCGDLLHERLEGNISKEPLKGDLLHRPYENLGEHLGTIMRYSGMWAAREFAKGRVSNLTDIALRPAGKFFKMYVLKRGVLDGGVGFIAAMMGGVYTFMKYARLYELGKRNR